LRAAVRSADFEDQDRGDPPECAVVDRRAHLLTFVSRIRVDLSSRTSASHRTELSCRRNPCPRMDGGQEAFPRTADVHRRAIRRRTTDDRWAQAVCRGWRDHVLAGSCHRPLCSWNRDPVRVKSVLDARPLFPNGRDLSRPVPAVLGNSNRERPTADRKDDLSCEPKVDPTGRRAHGIRRCHVQNALWKSDLANQRALTNVPKADRTADSSRATKVDPTGLRACGIRCCHVQNVS
jgi:hypothetical protein